MLGLQGEEDFLAISDLIIHILEVMDDQASMICVICTAQKAINDKPRITLDHVEQHRVAVQGWNSVSCLFSSFQRQLKSLGTHISLPNIFTVHS